MILFDSVNCPFLDGDVPRRPSYGVYRRISELVRFAREYLQFSDINNRKKFLMPNSLSQAEGSINKANYSDNEAAFFDLTLSIHHDTVPTKIFDKRDGFDFNIVNFPFLEGDVPRCTIIFYTFISTYSLCQSIFAC